MAAKTEKYLDFHKWLIDHDNLKQNLDLADFQIVFSKNFLTLSDCLNLNVNEVAEIFKKWLKKKVLLNLIYFKFYEVFKLN